jgi:hypothetical protein
MRTLQDESPAVIESYKRFYEGVDRLEMEHYSSVSIYYIYCHISNEYWNALARVNLNVRYRLVLQ